MFLKCMKDKMTLYTSNITGNVCFVGFDRTFKMSTIESLEELGLVTWMDNNFSLTALADKIVQ